MADAARRAARVPLRRRDRDALAERDARARLRLPRAADPLPPALPDGAVPRAARACVLAGLFVVVARRSAFFEQVLTSRLSTEGRGSSTRTSSSTTSSPTCSPSTRSSVSASTRSRSTTSSRRQDELRAALVLRRVVRRDRPRRNARVRRVPRLPLPPRRGDPADRPRARRARRPARRAVWPLGWGLTAAIVASMASNVFYLTMSFYYFYVIALLAIAAPAVFARRLDEAVKVARPDDVVPARRGRRRRDVRPRQRGGAERRRASRSSSYRPRAFATSGSPTATGSSTTCGQRRGRRWRCRCSSSPSPARPGGPRTTPTSSTRTGCRARSPRSRRASRSCSSSGARTSRSRGGCDRSRDGSCGARGSSSARRRRSPTDARALGARRRARDPERRRDPRAVGEPDEPPHALYVGRLSEEKGVRELAEAADGLPLVVVGDGPLRPLFPSAVGFVPPSELGPYYERAAVVVVPSRREGYGMVAREAMAHGRPGRGDRGRRPRRRGRGRRDRAPRAAGRRRRAAAALERAARATRRCVATRSGRPRAPRRRRALFAMRAASGAPRAHDDAALSARRAQATRQRRSVRSTRSPSSAVSFLPSSRERAA